MTVGGFSSGACRSPEDILLDAEVFAELHAAVDRLSPWMQAVVRWRYGFSDERVYWNGFEVERAALRALRRALRPGETP